MTEPQATHAATHATTGVDAAELEQLSWLDEMEAERAHERRMLVTNMGFSFVFHLALLVVVLSFFGEPPGKTEGVEDTEIMLADIPKLGDEDAPDVDGAPSEASADPRADAEEMTREDLSLEEHEKRVDDALDEVALRQQQELEAQRKAAAKATADDEARRVKGIRSADARIHGQLGKRGGIGGLEPRTFYGLKVHSKKLVLILDVSGSMNIPYAKMNLKNAYRSLGPKEKFALVCYSHTVWFWPKSKRLVYATKANKQAADRWVDELNGGGATNIHDALKTAFEISRGGESADTFYFLSDGFPTYGVKDSDAIVDATLKWNGREKVIMHTIGIGNHDVDLMSRLAKFNRGKYKPIR